MQQEIYVVLKECKLEYNGGDTNWRWDRTWDVKRMIFKYFKTNKIVYATLDKQEALEIINKVSAKYWVNGLATRQWRLSKCAYNITIQYCFNSFFNLTQIRVVSISEMYLNNYDHVFIPKSNNIPIFSRIPRKIKVPVSKGISRYVWSLIARRLKLPKDIRLMIKMKI